MLIVFEPLVSRACDRDECLSGDEYVHSGLDVQLVGDRERALDGSVGDWRFEGSYSTCKK